MRNCLRFPRWEWERPVIIAPPVPPPPVIIVRIGSLKKRKTIDNYFLSYSRLLRVMRLIYYLLHQLYQDWLVELQP